MDKIRVYTSLIISLLVGAALGINVYFYQNIQRVQLSPGESFNGISILTSAIVIVLLMVLSFFAVYFGSKREAKTEEEIEEYIKQKGREKRKKNK